MDLHPVACPVLAPPTPGEPPRLLDRVRQAARTRGHSVPTTDLLVSWSRAFILFHNKRHPSELGLPEVTHFLEHVVKTAADPLPALCRPGWHSPCCTAACWRPTSASCRSPGRRACSINCAWRCASAIIRGEPKIVTSNGARRFILFHHKRHPRTMGAAEIEQFLTRLAVDGHVSASTQNQALNALLFLYGQVLEIDLGRLDAVRARRGQRLPLVLTPEEVARVLTQVLGAGCQSR